MAFGLSAGAAGLLSAGVGAVGSAYASKKAAKNQTATTTNQLSPEAQSVVFGNGPGGDGKGGLISNFSQYLNKPEDANLARYEQGNLNYLSQSPQDMAAIRDKGYGLMGGTQAPQIGNAAWAQGSMVDAPKQNNMDLTGSYNSFIGGDRGGNTRLTQAIQGGIDQSNNAFSQMQGNATENLMENIMPSIRSNSVLSGQYGGSRQGIAEGNAIGDFAKAQQQTISQFGQNNTNAAVGAQANAYETDSNRALSATQGLGAQQYGVAQQNTATRNAAEFANVGQANQNYAQNAQFQQANNALNQNGVLAGAGLLSGQMGGAYQAGQNHDNYALNQAGKANGLLSPYLTSGGQSTSTQPMYQNTAGNMLGGAMAGLGLYNQFKQPAQQTGATNQNPWPT